MQASRCSENLRRVETIMNDGMIERESGLSLRWIERSDGTSRIG